MITVLPVMIAVRRWDMDGRLAPGDVVEWIVDFIRRGLEHEAEVDGRARKGRGGRLISTKIVRR